MSTVAERLYARLVPDTESDCLLWTGCVTPAGYGRIRVGGRKGKTLFAHRLAWELEVGPIPPGLVLDHVRDHGCTHANCANIAHLEPVTNRENILRSDCPTAINARKMRCPKDHLYDEANTYVSQDGRRACRECHRQQMAAARHLPREAA